MRAFFTHQRSRRTYNGFLKARFAAVRVRIADGPPQRIWNKGQQHLPGDEAWLIGEHRVSGEKKCYLANLPAGMDLRSLAATIKARWICEQVLQQLKEKSWPRPLRGKVVERSSSSGAHDHDRLCIPPTTPAHKREAGKKNQQTARQPTLPAVRHAIVDLIMRSSPRRCP
jgi:hypothetical protein